MQDTDRSGKMMTIPRKEWDALDATDEYTLDNTFDHSHTPLGWNRESRRHPNIVKVVPHDVYVATKARVEKRRAARRMARASRKAQR